MMRLTGNANRRPVYRQTGRYLRIAYAICVQLPATAQYEATISRVVDSSSFMIDGRLRVRIAGIVGPEQSYASESISFLRDLLQQGSVHVYPAGIDGGKMLARVTVRPRKGFQFDIAEIMVASGHATALERTGKLLQLETFARLHRRGLWAYSSEPTQ